MDLREWNRIWKNIQKDTDKPYTNAQILEHWKDVIPDGSCLREGWPLKTDTPHIKHLGYRKNSKLGHEEAGEKYFERKLLGERGKVKIHYIEKGDELLRLQVCFHNMGLGTAKNDSQKIIDCFGVIDVGNKRYPTAIEVKFNNQGPWYAVIENLIQVQMLQQNLLNVQKYFGGPPFSFGTLSGAWGIVLAPENYFTGKNEESYKKACDLIAYLHDEVRITLVSCNKQVAGAETNFGEPKNSLDNYWRLSYSNGFWP